MYVNPVYWSREKEICGTGSTHAMKFNVKTAMNNLW